MYTLGNVLVSFLQPRVWCLSLNSHSYVSYKLNAHTHTQKKRGFFHVCYWKDNICWLFYFLFFFPSHPFFKILMPSCNFGNDILDAIFGWMVDFGRGLLCFFIRSNSSLGECLTSTSNQWKHTGMIFPPLFITYSWTSVVSTTLRHMLCHLHSQFTDH